MLTKKEGVDKFFQIDCATVGVGKNRKVCFKSKIKDKNKNNIESKMMTVWKKNHKDIFYNMFSNLKGLVVYTSNEVQTLLFT